MLGEMNQGYMNSAIPVRVALHCTELASLQELQSASDMLSAFKKYKSSGADLRYGGELEHVIPPNSRQTADAAMLLVKNFNSCGIGYIK